MICRLGFPGKCHSLLKPVETAAVWGRERDKLDWGNVHNVSMAFHVERDSNRKL